ncbi:hypothetical protein [Arthrobacter alpinus]|uniref:hypothetical protein n=1 Tax=Arthrobacter alpinus TaxID=656366 RepID=UPI001646B915|nr:hypothetical protein [Arthrobacter alpinus]
MCRDTGVVFGRKLTALRYPAREVVVVPAERVWFALMKPVAATKPTVQERAPGMLKVEDVMSRSGADPRWMPYLTPTMSPAGATKEVGYLEHPGEAYAAYRAEGVEHVICEEKHMGFLTVVVLTRDAEDYVAAYRR